MTRKLRSILDSISGLVTFDIDKPMTDDDFIASVDAANLLCNLHDSLGLDRSEIRENMDAFYPEFLRRICGKSDIQQSVPLIKALHRYIYGRKADNADRGPGIRRNSLAEQCLNVVAAYRKIPQIHSVDYLYAMLTAASITDCGMDEAIAEYRARLDGYVADIDAVTVDEQIRRVWAYTVLRGHMPVANYEKWIEATEALKHIGISKLDDESFLLWCEATESWPADELKRRSQSSKRLQVEYLHVLAYAEIKTERRTAENRKLNRAFKALDDEFIGDIIGIKIDSDMSVSTLYALETIFLLRLQLAEVSGDDKASTYRSLCRSRYGEISKVLTAKYPSATTINEKIEILERIQEIEMFLRNDYSEFALEEAQELAGQPGLTYSQQLRLSNIFNFGSDDFIADIDTLLAQAKDAFDMKTLLDIEQFGTDIQRRAVMGKYRQMFHNAITENDIAALARLLTAAAYTASNPQWRPLLASLAIRVVTAESLTLPERHITAIAAAIYSKINALTGKYYGVNDIIA